MPIQSFSFLDCTGVFLCFSTFTVVIYFLCLIINYTLVLDDDEISRFEIFGANHNFKLGRRPLSMVRGEIQIKNQLKLERRLQFI